MLANASVRKGRNLAVWNWGAREITVWFRGCKDGGGGNRTRVPKPLGVSLYARSPLFGSRLLGSNGRDTRRPAPEDLTLVSRGAGREPARFMAGRPRPTGGGLGTGLLSC